MLKFEIRNSFAEWEQAFYSHQPTARAAGIFELHHSHEPDDEKRCAWFIMLSVQNICRNLWKRTMLPEQNLDTFSSQPSRKSMLISR